jgi:hypothetical protein
MRGREKPEESRKVRCGTDDMKKWGRKREEDKGMKGQRDVKD